MTRFLVVPLALGLLACTSHNALAEWVVSFREDFTDALLDPIKWQVEHASGTYLIQDGRLLMRSSPSGLPTIVTTPGAIPTAGDFRVRIGFQYGRTTCYGTRLGLQASSMSGPGCTLNDPAIYQVHRDCAIGTNVRATAVGTYQNCPIPTENSVVFEPGEPTPHTVEWAFDASGVTAAIDGQVLATAAGPQLRPDRVFFGWGDPCCDYTEFDVEFVEIQVWDEPVPTSFLSWGKLKSTYR
jgi:hypothetical protein